MSDSPVAGVSSDEEDNIDASKKKTEETKNIPSLSKAATEPASTLEALESASLAFAQGNQESKKNIGKRPPPHRTAYDDSETKKSRLKSPSEGHDNCLSITLMGGKTKMLPIISHKENPSRVVMEGLLGTKMPAIISEVTSTIERKKKQVEKESHVSQCRMRGTSMWVDKYAPKTFIQLISDERCNRAVLQWLKGWDEIVFGKRSKQHSNSMIKTETSSTLPESKILLLTGSPGVGKTTLAHILARQAGYLPMEINASDERSAVNLRARLEALTETQSINGAQGRPICVILDEIDGSIGSEGQGTVGVICKLAQDNSSTKKKKKSEEEHGISDEAENEDTAKVGSLSKRKKKSSAKILRRPIICICNDLYAASLRPLRKFAQIVRFNTPSPARLIERLLDICKSEGIKMNRPALSALYDIHHGDIRACVTALQMISADFSLDGSFIDAGKLRQLVSSSSRDLGLSSGIFELWMAIFDQSYVKRKASSTAALKQSVSNAEKATQQTLDRMLEAHSSEIQLVLNGCHENYPTVKYTDPHLMKTLSCLEALCDADCIQSKIHKHQQFAMMPYLPFAVHRINLACSTSASTTIEFPRSMTQNSQLERERRSILESFKSNMISHKSEDGSGHHNSRLSNVALSTEYIPSLCSILNPPSRMTNTMALSREQRERMERHVSIMKSFGLSYQKGSRQKSSNPDTQDSMSFNIDPDIESIGFLSYSSTSESSVQAKLSSEFVSSRTKLSQETIHQLQQLLERRQINPHHQEMKKQTNQETAQDSGLLSKRKSFGQAGWASASQHQNSRQTLSKSNAVAHSVKYKFNEGVTNGIKRPVLMKDLIVRSR